VPDLWIDLLGCLDLHGGADERSDADDIMTFDGASQQLQYHRVFGGQLLGQFIGAAQLTCPDKTVKSLHAVFARESQAAEPVRYQSTRQHQGRSFASLTITAHQTRGVLASSSVSMHAVEDGPEYQDREPVPALLGEKHRAELDLIPWETRCADDLNASPPAHRDSKCGCGPRLSTAISPSHSPPTPPTSHSSELRCVPSTVSTTAATARWFTSAVTSHTVWFHRPFRTDRWLLLRQHSPVLAHGRCFGRGDVLTEDGTLVASYAQEALLRFRDGGESGTT
jgi:acyl-CoA thioesterase-2